MAGTIVKKTGIKRKKGYLYFVDKAGNVRSTKMARGRKRKSSAKKKRTARRKKR